METDISIEIPNHLQSKCGRNLHWDFYRVDVKLKGNRVIHNLSVHSAKAFVPVSGESNAKYNFTTREIRNIRPASLVSRVKTYLLGW